MRKIGSIFAVLFSLSLYLCAVPATAQQGLRLEPIETCGALRDFHLDAGAGSYKPRDAGGYQCRSRKRRLPLGEPLQNEVRYSAFGDKENVQKVELYVDVFGRREVQPTLRRMLQYSRVLVESLLGQTLSEEIENAILSANFGNWKLGSARLTLSRNSATGSRGFRYTLVLD